ncbi:anthranilate synthase family protein [Brevibacterium sp. 91QC2O2]|uniref:anthranilate synthase family protein n=1 Tax=Brevibacterium TaxID=1696 RepID=UPI00359C49EE
MNPSPAPADTPTPLQRITALRSATTPFALISRGNGVELLTGTIADVQQLADIPLHDDAGSAREVLAMVPFNRIRERGYAALDDGAPLRCLLVDEHSSLPLAQTLDALPKQLPRVHDAGFTTSDEEYARIARQVIDREIGTGAGANFVIRRDFTGRVDADPRTTALAWFRALLERERGAYWTFAIVLGDLVAVGASPEAHVVARGGAVTMNPISGTFRHVNGRPDPAAFAEFLNSTKETEELFMVVDEEMKMMSQVCSSGGRISGPRLKRMSRLTHTEYVLRGASQEDPRRVLRQTMFAPTVTGSPMQNACSVIARYETSPRGYYSGVAALFSPEAAGGHELDAPILIRTAYLRDGMMSVSAGATLVRHSDPLSEAAETAAKVSGLLRAIGVDIATAPIGATAAPSAEPSAPPAGSTAPGELSSTEVEALLHARNSRLAAFWLQRQPALSTRKALRAPFTGFTAVVVDAEDRFSTMLAHQLRHLGLDVEVVAWDAVTEARITSADLLVAGPGPGDPRNRTDPRIAQMRQLIVHRRAAGRPLLAVCLSHQLLALECGLDLRALDEPHQGVQLSVPVFGADARIGFYNTFAARVAPGTLHAGGAEVAADPVTGVVAALRGPGFASVQGHLESVLSTDGLTTLTRLVAQALGHSKPRSESAPVAPAVR